MTEIIARFVKNSVEEVRLSLTEFKGHKLIDIRAFYLDLDNEYKPTKKGIAISVDLYPELRMRC